MLFVTEDFRQAAKQPVREWECEVVITSGDTTTEVLSSKDKVISLTTNEAGSLSISAARMATLKILDQDGKDVAKYTGKDAFLRLGLKTSQDALEWVSLGKYIVDTETVDKAAGTRSIKLIDAITKLQDIEYQEGMLEFPTTVRGLAAQIAEQSGLELAAMDTLPNIDYGIVEDLYANIQGANFRSIIEEIAGATGSMAKISGGNILEFRKPQFESQENLTYGDLKALTIGEHYGPINSVVLSRQPQEDNIVVTDDESIALSGLTEAKLANNEIMDDEREVFAQPLLDALTGLEYNAFEATTVGLGWFEVGDRISLQDENGVTWEGLITEITRTIDGAVKEILKCVIPDGTTTDYALAGGISKTIYNTEIKVDKQEQQISSIVERQDTLESEMISNFSRVDQTIENVTTTIQTTGGGNLLLNSVGYAKDNDGALQNWALEQGSVSSSSSPESVQAGALSGNQISLSANSRIVQRVQVAAGQEYSFSCRVRKGASGSATISLTNESDNYVLEIAANESFAWDKLSLSPFVPYAGYIDVIIETDGDVSAFAITDLMLNIGNSIIPWVQASSEILNTQVQITTDGVEVKSSVYEGDSMVITPLEVAGYSNVSGTSKKVFSLNRDTTVVQKLRSEEQIEMPPFKIVPISSGPRAGWNFVKIN